MVKWSGIHNVHGDIMMIVADLKKAQSIYSYHIDIIWGYHGLRSYGVGYRPSPGINQLDLLVLVKLANHPK